MNIAVFLLENCSQAPVTETEDETVSNTGSAIRLPPLRLIENGCHKAGEDATQCEEAPERCDELIEHRCPKAKEVHEQAFSC